MKIIGEGLSNVEVEIKDATGTTVDFPFNFIVFNS